MRVFFCTKKERRVRNISPILYDTAKEYPVLSLSRKASLTVEAAFVLPVFLFAMLVFLYFMRYWQGYGQIAEGLAVTARQASQRGVFEKNEFYRYLEENGGSFSYISGGKSGISLKDSYISPVTEKIRVKAEYKVILPIPFFSGPGMVVHQEVKSRVFSGTEAWCKGSAAEGGFVYVTKYGSVYHLHRGCSSLNPSIRMVFGTEVFSERNKKGGKYKPCGACMKNQKLKEQALYITEEGDYFHSTPGCMGLNRTIYKVPFSEAAGMNACSKCSQ